MSAQPIKAKDRDTVIQALRAGVVPRVGLRHVQVGRAREVQEIIKDVARVKEGGSTVRFVIGDYGSGKTSPLSKSSSSSMPTSAPIGGCTPPAARPGVFMRNSCAMRRRAPSRTAARC